MDLCNCAFSGILILLEEPIDAEKWHLAEKCGKTVLSALLFSNSF